MLEAVRGSDYQESHSSDSNLLLLNPAFLFAYSASMTDSLSSSTRCREVSHDALGTVFQVQIIFSGPD